ncbi:MAG: polymer-forming cytoskeletal protein [Proteobacteria bacterium]|nr:polymer-forming cytoskeletal protein [Pseudomonadota bacterium]
MFTKPNKEAERKPVLPITPAPPSLLSTDLKIVGNLHSEGEIQVDGAVEGDIDANVLVIGETAQVNGEVSADVVRVHGFVTGQIKARSVSLAKTAHVQGDILHESLAIEQGAFLEGHCRRVEDARQRKKDGKKEGEGGINLLGVKPKVEASEAAE